LTPVIPSPPDAPPASPTSTTTYPPDRLRTQTG
jgi:hypothetical protein